MTLTQSLASERSRDITFTALVPWFSDPNPTRSKILTLADAPTYTLTLTLTESQTLTLTE